MSLIDLIALWRKLPVPVRELVVTIVHEIVSSPDQNLAARRALEATRTQSLDEMLKAKHPRQ